MNSIPVVEIESSTELKLNHTDHVPILWRGLWCNCTCNVDHIRSESDC